MPVLRPMQPVLYEQYPTGAGGGVAPQGRGGYQGQNVDVSGFITPPNPLEEASAAVNRAMRMAGISPGSFSPAAQAIRKKAGALVNELVLHAAMTGQENALASPAEALSLLSGIIQRGLSGEKIFGGKGDALQTLVNLAETTNLGEGATKGAAIIGQLLGNPQNAEALFMQAKYGGLSGQAQGALATSLQGVMDKYAQTLEGGAASQYNAAGVLRNLLGLPPTAGGGQLPPEAATPGLPGAGGTPAGPAGAGALAQGAGTGSTATPSLPSALSDPVGAMMQLDKQRAINALGGQGASPAALAAGAPDLAGLAGQQFGGLPSTGGGGGAGFSAPPAGFAGGAVPEPFATLLRLQQQGIDLRALAPGYYAGQQPVPTSIPGYGMPGSAYSGGGAY